MKNTVARKLVALGALVTIALAGCTSSKEEPTATSSPSNSVNSQAASAPKGFETYYSQSIEWKKCGATFKCATVQAPMDWENPESAPIKLAIKLSAVKGEAKGTILLNPGGPGGSGIELVTYAPLYFGQKLVSGFNLLGFDPRGVGQSDAVSCFEPKQMDKYLALSYDPTNSKALAIAENAVTQFAKACQENTGELLGHVDTQSSAKDMDLLRALMGDEKLNYLGFSYGTQLGATYAGLFPQKVGKMVLDGAIDLRLSSFEQSKQQAIGFENALTAFVEGCLQTNSCPVKGGTPEVLDSVSKLFDDLGKNPMQTDMGSRQLTQSLAFYGVAQPLYAEQLWPRLNEALTQAIQQRDGSLLLDLSDEYFGRDQNGSYLDNQTEAFSAINCLDDRSSADLATMEKEAAEIQAAAPVMGDFFTYGGIGCKNWPYEQVAKDFDISAAGAAPIIVIGTTNDPATPYVWAQGLAEHLESGVLVTHVGEGHTAYGQGSECIVDVVDSYFVEGKVPTTDPNCEG